MCWIVVRGVKLFLILLMYIVGRILCELMVVVVIVVIFFLVFLRCLLEMYMLGYGCEFRIVYEVVFIGR